MASRCPDMDAARAQLHGSRLRWSPRVLCVVAGLLCTVGVLSGAMLRASGVAHHHSVTAAAVVTVTDGHGTVLRGDHHVVAAASTTTSPALYRMGAAAAAPTSVDVVTIDSVRTRGPPALA
jgi:hypothetical protein